MTREQQYGYEAVVGALMRSGVRCIFGVLGDDTAPVVVHSVARGISYYAARHENQAVAMADGYSRSTGKRGIAVLTGGPGFTNALTALYTAHRAGSSVLVLTGAGRPQEDDHSPDGVTQTTPVSWLKYFPQAAVLAAAGIPCVKPLTADRAGRETEQALQLSQSGPAVLILGREVLMLRTEETEEFPDRAIDAERATGDIDASKVAELADLLQESWAVKNPLILAGRGAMTAGAGNALQELARRIGALLATSLPARGLFHGDPFSLGVCGTYATPLATELIMQADCIIAFGASLNPWTTYRNSLFPKALLIQVDADPGAIGRFLPTAIGIQGDARMIAQALITELERRKHQSHGCRSDALRDRIAAQQGSEDVKDRGTADLIDPRILMLALDKKLPIDRILCTDAGQQARFAIRYIGTSAARNFSQPVDAGSIGLGIGVAIGTAVARPSQLVVATLGDGSAMMSLGDLETAVRLRLALLVVISNDESYGAEVNAITNLGMDPRIANTPCPSFEAMALAMGARAATVRKVADLRAIDQWILDRPAVPLVLDCRVNPAVRAD